MTKTEPMPQPLRRLLKSLERVHLTDTLATLFGAAVVANQQHGHTFRINIDTIEGPATLMIGVGERAGQLGEWAKQVDPRPDVSASTEMVAARCLAADGPLWWLDRRKAKEASHD